jgi:hypothetical protein
VLMNWGCVPPLLPGGASTYSCRSTEVTYNTINSWWRTSMTVPPGYLCVFQYCGPGGVTVVCNSIAHKGRKPLVLRADPNQKH